MSKILRNIPGTNRFPIASGHLASLFLLILILLHGCDKEPNGPGRVAFLQPERTLNTDQLSAVVFHLAIDPPASDSSEIFIEVFSSGGLPGIAFETSPPVSDGLITLPVLPGDEKVSFDVYPDKEGIGYNSVFIDFEITGTGEGLVADGLEGVFSSLIILNTKDPVRTLPFSENFDACEQETGDGSLPIGWEEQVVTQNSLGTGRWECASGAFGLECNAYAVDGFNGDDCEVWLLSPPVSLAGETDPSLTFWTDRRFDTPGFREYEVRISTNYTRENFSAADWTLFEPAVAAIEANDPGADDYEQTDPLDLSTYAGDTITIAWIYFAEGSGLTSTILRIDDVVVY